MRAIWSRVACLKIDRVFKNGYTVFADYENVHENREARGTLAERRINGIELARFRLLSVDSISNREVR